MHFIDLHSHFMPGVDDGPANLEETAEMLRFAHDCGTRVLVATPHMFFEAFGNFDVAAIRAAFAGTMDDLREMSRGDEYTFLTELTLHLGAENYASPELLEALRNDDVITLNGSRYLLVEFPLVLPARQLVMVIERILTAGLVPVLAHVERYVVVQNDPAFLERLLALGCLSQVNGSSFVDHFWSQRRKTAVDLLKHGLISLVASDGHGVLRRPPDLKEPFVKLERGLSSDRLEKLFVTHAKWIVGNQCGDFGM